RVVEQRRDAGAIAEFRALPGNDDQCFRRFLIAQNGHAERLSSGDGGQLRVFFRLWLSLFSLFLCLFLLCLFRLWLRCLLRECSRGRQGKDRKQNPVNASLPHRSSGFFARLRRSAIHLTTSASSGTIRLYA